MWDFIPTDMLWRNALGAVPLALLVGAICRYLPCRPATRHVLWLMVLLWLVAPPIMPSLELSTPPVKAPAAVMPVAEKLVADLAPPSLADAEALPPVAGLSELEPLDEHLFTADEIFEAVPCRQTYAEPSIAPQREPDPPTEALPTEPCSPQLLALATGPVGAPRGPLDIPPLVALWAEADLSKRDRDVVYDDADEAAWTTSFDGETCGPDRDVTGADRVDDRMAYVPAEAPLPGKFTLAAGSDFPTSLESPVAQGWPRAEYVAAPAATVGSDEEIASVPSAGDVEVLRSTWREWFAGLTMVRDAVGRLPAFPTDLWVLGGAVFLMIKVIAVLRFRRCLRSAVPAGEPVTRMVKAVASRIGLRKIPVALMTDGAMSPMVLLGQNPRLLLPAELWAIFDNASREAIICHELAHLRRRDHWVCWADVVIGALYWWHPLVWWVRHRLHNEAEFCCDAWVTWLLPKGRRAYAEALLITKQFVYEQSRSVPAVGIGVTSGRARRFGRRLTMVMTQTNRPGLSAPGIALAAALAMAGWVAAPARSCPEDEKCDKAKSASTVVLASDCSKHAKTCEKCSSGEACGKCPAKDSDHDHLTSFEQYMAAKKDGALLPGYVLAGDPDEDDLEARLSRLEDELERLSEQLGRVAEHLGDRDVRREHIERRERQEQERRERREAREPREARQPRAPRPPRPAMPPMPPPADAPSPMAIASGETFVRSYSLPEGKLEALTALMARSDVPILVSPKQDRIDVQANAAQHVSFGAFVDMLNAEEQSRSYEVPDGRLQALTELMVRDDVPVLVAPRDGSIEVQGTALQQTVFRNFVDMIAPSGVRVGVGRVRGAEAAATALEARVKAEGKVRKAIKEKKEKKEKVRTQKKSTKRTTDRRDEAEDSYHAAVLGQAEAVLGKERIEALGRSLAALAESEGVQQAVEHAARYALESRKQEFQNQEQGLHLQAERLQYQSQMLREKAAQQIEKARQFEEKMRQLQDQARQLDEQAEMLNDEAAALPESERMERLAEAETAWAESLGAEASADELGAEAEAVVAEADRLTDQADSYTEAAEALRETAEALAERAYVSAQTP